jgi:hypothetical protein
MFTQYIPTGLQELLTVGHWGNSNEKFTCGAAKHCHWVGSNKASYTLKYLVFFKA